MVNCNTEKAKSREIMENLALFLHKKMKLMDLVKVRRKYFIL